MYPMRPLGGLLPEILHAELLSERFSLFAESVSGRTGIPKINRSDLDSYEINIPPVVEQYRIVEILRSVQDRIDAEQIALRKSDSLWNGALNAELERHFLDYAPSKLVEVSLGGGEYGSNSSASPHRVDMPRYVRITDIDDRGFLARADSAAASIPLTAARTGFTTGKSYLYRASDGVCAFAGYLVRFRINPREMVPEYAFLWTTGNMFRGWVSRNVREVGQRNISAREYNDHEIAHPPVSVQRRLADAARIARESRQLRTLEIDRLYTLRSALAGDLLGDRASSSTVH
jgi:type I restriction enzyme S subunit